MTDYRIYIRNTVAGFDFVTPETAIYAQIGFGFQTPTTTAVGVFDNSSIGRKANTASLINIFSDTAAVPGDLVAIISSSGTARVTAPFRPQGSGWLLALPDDQVGIASLTGTRAEIFVNDLSDEQLIQYLSNTACCEPVFPPFEIVTLTLNAPAQLPAFSGEMVVFLDFALDGDVTLQNLADAPEGSKITFIRTGGLGVPRIVADALTDEVNGSTDVIFTPYPLRSSQDSIRYYRVQSGWQRDLGTHAGPLINTAVTPTDIPAASEGTQYVLSRIIGPGTINLPDVTLCRAGYRIVVSNTGTGTLTVAPFGAQDINGVLTTYTIPVIGTAMFEVSGSAAASEWIAIEQSENPPVITDAAALVAVPAFRGFGRQIVRVTNATGVNVTLPAVGTLQVGASIQVENIQGTNGIATVTPNGAELINGLDRRVIAMARSAIFVNDGIGWSSVDGIYYIPPTTSAADPAVVPLWIDSPFHFESTSVVVGHDIILPAASAINLDGLVIIFNNSVEAADLLPNGADTLNGGAGLVIPAAGTAAVWWKSNTEWIAVISA